MNQLNNIETSWKFNDFKQCMVVARWWRASLLGSNPASFTMQDCCVLCNSENLREEREIPLKQLSDN